MPCLRRLLIDVACSWLLLGLAGPVWADPLSQQVRSLLSNRCFACHGPDAQQREGGLRLDDRGSYLSPADSGQPPVVPGDVAGSTLWQRVVADDPDQRMPPAHHGLPLAEDERALIAQWIEQGAPLLDHWSFVPPQRPVPPSPAAASRWAAAWTHPVDRFVLAEQLSRQLEPSPEASRPELLRRVTLDLTGLPPTLAEIAEFEADPSPAAYERQVDRLLASPALGEHWARKWLDLARYADSAGYADDPDRTIWAYRDWVIRALNENLPIDQFTIEQLAGDLLPEPTASQLTATAFHRNTLTNNEGGTNDEEFRNVAVVDRVNTTLAVWMGVTMGCAQCHSHKYDPFTQAEYFQLFAIFNQTEDADRKDESPTLDLYSDAQRDKLAQWQRRLAELEVRLLHANGLTTELAEWEHRLRHPDWQRLSPIEYRSLRGHTARFDSTGAVRVQPQSESGGDETQVLRLQLTGVGQPIQALAIQTVPDASLAGGAGWADGNFVLTGVQAALLPDQTAKPLVRYVRVELPGQQKILSLAEVEVFVADQNVAVRGQATQSSTDYDGQAGRANDGNTNGDYFQGQSTTHTRSEDSPWWEVELAEPAAVERLVIWNRTDGQQQARLNGARVLCLDSDRQELFSQTLETAPAAQVELPLPGTKPIRFIAAQASYQQSGFPAEAVIAQDAVSGWAVGGRIDQPHRLILIPEQAVVIDGPATLQVTLEHRSPRADHLLLSFAVEASSVAAVRDWGSLSPALQAIHQLPPEQRSAAEQQQLAEYFARNLADSTRETREEIERLQGRVAAVKPTTSVPILRELTGAARRNTFVHLRGDYRAHGQQVQPGGPAVFPPLTAASGGQPDRLDLARWLMAENNPLTARVWVNRLWESLFGLGIVRTSEEFGAQGEPPSHPRLLDWLATELIALDWDFKALLRLIVTSQTYRQTSAVSAELLDRDRDNVWLARGPRVRLTAEMIRDQSLVTAGLLAQTLYGPPVQPPQPAMGLRAAFGSDTDWTPSQGADQYRRGVYTKWRRSNPYPSMATFDAPSREVCILRRDSTNSPLQALVTLNDPAFVAAAQGLARRVVLYERAEGDDADRLNYAFQLCTARLPEPTESRVLLELLASARDQLTGDFSQALQLATDPLGSLPPAASPPELAAWTAVCNVLLNLDEVLMKR